MASALPFNNFAIVKHIITVILSVVLLLVACGRDNAVKGKLMIADGLIFVRPEAALTLLDSLDSSNESDMTRAWHTVLLVKANEKTYRRYLNDSLTAMAAEFFRGRGDSLEVQALFYNGVVQGYNQNYADALISLIEAAEKAAGTGNCFYQAMAYREQADIYSSLMVESKHLELADSARQCFLKAARPVHAIREYLSVAEALVSLGRIDSALVVLTAIRADSAIVGAPAFYAAYHRLMTDIYTQKGDYSAANIHLDSVAIYAKGLTSVELSQRSRLYSFTGDYEAAGKALGEAGLYLYEQADTTQFELSQSVLFAKLNKYHSAYNAFLRYFNDYAGTRRQLLTHPYTSIVSEYYKQQSENRNDELLSTRTLMWAWSIIAVLFCALLIAIIIIYRRRLREKVYRSEALLSDIDRLQKVIDSHNAADAQPLEPAGDKRHKAFASHYSVINSLCEISSCMPDTSDGYAMLGKNVAKLVATFRTDEALTEIEDFVNDRFDGLMTKFRSQYPTLTERNYRFVVLSFAGFSGPSITTILNIKSPNALRTMRHRIKRHIDEHDSPDRDLFISFLR